MNAFRRPDRYRARNLVGTALLAPVLFATPVLADQLADYRAGVAAFDAGDFAAAFTTWLPLAHGGDRDAQRNIGLLYQSGRGTAVDLGAAFYWYRVAAEAGDGRAANAIAMMYLAGEGLPSDYVAAGAWLLRAARAGHAPARYNLGLLYERGLGVDPDDEVALGWFVLAAEAGLPGAVERAIAARTRLARQNVGNTRPTPEPPELAAAIARGLAVDEATSEGALLADLRTPPAPAILVAEAAEARAGLNRVAIADRAARGAQAFARGDWAAALGWLVPAALAGDTESQFLVGNLYARGLAVEADPSQAVAWWALAAAQGHAEAAAAVETAGRGLDADQLERATRLLAARNGAARLGCATPCAR